MSTTTRILRRSFLMTAGASLAAPALAQGAGPAPNLRNPGGVRRNASAFTVQRWQDHFDSVERVTIICDTGGRALHYWGQEGEDYRLYPTSVPRTDELTRRGYTEIVRKVVGPDWRPTENMKRRDPSLPDYMPPGPGNPLGTHAMYLSWPAYLIHGTHDTRKIGRRSSSGCIGLYNPMIEELYGITPVGAQVRMI